jgi:hypothetical protein
VDQLGEIPEVPEEQIEKLSAIMGGESQRITISRQHGEKTGRR